MDPLAELADRWRDEAATFRSYGAEQLAQACEKHAEELAAAAGAARLEAVTLEQAAEIGGYSYSHLQHLVAEETIPNVGTEGAPRIRRSEVPRKPGHGVEDDSGSRAELVDEAVALHRAREA